MKKHIALILAAGTLLLAGCCTNHHVTQWEYKKVGSIEEANKAAADGWIVSDYSTYIEGSHLNGSMPDTRYDWGEVYLLKRPKH